MEPTSPGSNSLLQSSKPAATAVADSSVTMVVEEPATAYRDYSHLTDEDESLKELLKKADTEGVKGTDQSFPVKLHQLLSGSDEDGFSSIVSWQPHGRSFIVKKHAEFVDSVLPCCFRQTKFASFQRQLNLYGFSRIASGRDKGGYFHPLFLRGRSLLALKMQRTKVKGTGARKPSQPSPDFYSMHFVGEKQNEKPAPAASPPPPVTAASPTASMPTSAAAASPSLPPLDFPRSLPNFSPNSKPYIQSVNLTGMNSSFGSSRSMTRSGIPSLIGPDPVPGVSRREIMAQMIATSSRLQSLRESTQGFGVNALDNRFLLGSTTGHSTFGPLHLNAFNMPCNCSMPAYCQHLGLSTMNH